MKETAVLAVILFFLVCTIARCQELPNAPSKFWTRERVVMTSVLAAEVGYDGYATQTIPRFRERNPIISSLVKQGPPGQAAACVIGMGVALGTSYLLHKAGHEKLSRWSLRLIVAGEAVNDWHQVKEMGLI